MRFTKALRKQIVEDFASRHGGTFDAGEFLKEVRKAGSKHPAYDWFEWDDDKAANEYRLEQARAFASDLRVKFSVEQIGRNKTISIREVSAPLVMSPISGRSDGGGYLMFDPSDPEMQAELCKEAGNTLKAWAKRYAAALSFAGCDAKIIDSVVGMLEAKSPAISEAAE